MNPSIDTTPVPSPESRVTRDHRERAARALSEIGKPVMIWIVSGQIDPLAGPFNHDLCEVALAFAEFEHELLMAREERGSLIEQPSPELHVYWDQDSIWVVARDADDAALVYAEHIGDIDSFEPLEFQRVADDQEMSIRVWVLGPHAGEIAPVDEEDGTDAFESKRLTARAWADQQGRGFLCMTD
jgi:hypothetical protein